MDAHLRREVDAFLRDLWDGTDLEIALRKAGLNISFIEQPGDEIDLEGRDTEVLKAYRDEVFDRIHEEEAWANVRERWDAESFAAVSEDNLRDIMAEIIGELQ